MSYQTRAYDGASFTSRMRAAVRKGIGTVMLNDRPSGFWNSALSNGTARPSPIPKKSPIGALTAGVAARSQYISRRTSRRCSALRGMVPLIQMRWTMPAPRMSARSTLAPGGTTMNAAPLAPLLTVPPAPRAPVGFSGLIHRVCTSCMRYRLSGGDCANAADGISAARARARQRRDGLFTPALCPQLGVSGS